MGSRSAAGARPVATLVEISRVLEETARLVREHAYEGEGAQAAQALTPPQVRAILSLRSLRAHHLGFDATDGAWAMLLELYAAHLEGKRVHQTKLALAAGVPHTTALMATRRLLESGVFTRAEDPQDRRLLMLGLSDAAAAAIAAYLEEAQRTALLLA